MSMNNPGGGDGPDPFNPALLADSLLRVGLGMAFFPGDLNLAPDQRYQIGRKSWRMSEILDKSEQEQRDLLAKSGLDPEEIEDVIQRFRGFKQLARRIDGLGGGNG